MRVRQWGDAVETAVTHSERQVYLAATHMVLFWRPATASSGVDLASIWRSSGAIAAQIGDDTGLAACWSLGLTFWRQQAADLA